MDNIFLLKKNIKKNYYISKQNNQKEEVHYRKAVKG